jgi:ABC-type uncharacterized transport system ATPase subunit
MRPGSADTQPPRLELAELTKRFGSFVANEKVSLKLEPGTFHALLEADEVLGRLRRMVESKQLSVLIITHKFREVTAYCDEVTVLRKGKVTGRGKVKDLTKSDMATMMIGEQRSGRTIEKSVQEFGLPLLQIKGLEANRDNGVRAFTGFDLSVRAGEIVGVAGVSARELGPGTANILVVANPCMGLDFGAVDFIHSQLLEARNRNVAILLLSEDLDELVALSDRLVVMAAGKIVYSAPIDEIDRQLIGEKMASH